MVRKLGHTGHPLGETGFQHHRVEFRQHPGVRIVRRNAVRKGHQLRQKIDLVVSVSFDGHHGVRSTSHRTQTKHKDTGQWMKTSASHTRVLDRIENFYNRHRVRRLANGLGHPKFRSSIAYNCKSITEVLNILGFLMRLPCRETTDEIFDLRPGLFDGIELRRVRWGEEHGASRLVNTLEFSGVLMSRQNIHYDDIAWSKVGEKLLGDESIEYGDACSRIDRHSSTKAVKNDGSDHRERGPTPLNGLPWSIFSA